MKKLFFFSACILFSAASFAQGEIGSSQKQVRNDVNKYIKEHDLKNTAVEETDSTILLAVKDDPVKVVKFTYHFDRAGKCDSKMVSGCTECFQPLLNEIVANKKFEWIQIGYRTYVSKFEKQLTILTGNNKQTGPYFIVKKTPWTKTEYKDVLLK